MSPEPDADPAFEALLDFLKRNRGFDFTGYKRASLARRVTKRMRDAGIQDFAAYMDYLEVHPGEFEQLFNTILINVTAFFRDPDSWDYLASEVLPLLIAAKHESEPIRVWSAGCASGEEAYSIAILLAEALGIPEFRRRVKIYATDVDEEALEQARRAVYSTADLEGVSPERMDRFFEAVGDEFVFRPELRRSVIFGRHDLVKDPPMSRLDLILCRNVLMYLNSQTQDVVYARFHFALNPTGYLFLGRAEMMLSRTDLFEPVELKHRVFSRRPAATPRDQLLTLAQAGSPLAEGQLADEFKLRAAAFDALPCAQVVLDDRGRMVLANARARQLFGLEDADLGKLIQDLELSYRPIELRSLIDRARQQGESVTVPDVVRVDGGESRHFEVEVSPLRSNGIGVFGISIGFFDRTASHLLQEELQVSTSKLEQTTQAYHSATEELETTNEELQSTNEELETTNEELQSSNEELETMNEELQSTNEELRQMNDILQQRTHEIDDSNAFLESVLAGLRAACAVVDTNLCVRVWKQKMEELWGLRAEEVEGQSLLGLDIGLPVDALQDMIEACLRGAEDVPRRTIEAVNRRGKRFECIVSTTPLFDIEGAVKGAILMMEPRGDAGEKESGREA